MEITNPKSTIIRFPERLKGFYIRSLQIVAFNISKEISIAYRNSSSSSSKFHFRQNTTLIQEQKTTFVNTRSAHNIDTFLRSAGGHQGSRNAHQG